jgi:serine O-acetyltransferase
MGTRALQSRGEALSQICGGDELWSHIRREAEEALSRDGALAPLLVGPILNRCSLADAVSHRVAARLAAPDAPEGLIVDAYAAALIGDPSIAEAIRADLAAVIERDPVCSRLIEPLLYFKGFHAIAAHRLTHYLWTHGKRDFALYLQSRSSDALQTDIHPAALFGRGIFLDHATGLVVGETAVVGDDVSILQDVTLGGTGKEAGDRHPKVRWGVLIGAGVKILGNIEIGHCSRIAAGSVVLRDVPRNVTVAGVPAKIVGAAGCAEPARDMDQLLRDVAYDSFTYSI